MKCPHCGRRISDRLIRSEADRLNTAARKEHFGGRQRSGAPRCPCGASTLRRAQARGFDCCRRAGVESRMSKTGRTGQEER